MTSIFTIRTNSARGRRRKVTPVIQSRIFLKCVSNLGGGQSRRFDFREPEGISNNRFMIPTVCPKVGGPSWHRFLGCPGTLGYCPLSNRTLDVPYIQNSMKIFLSTLMLAFVYMIYYRVNINNEFSTTSSQNIDVDVSLR